MRVRIKIIMGHFKKEKTITLMLLLFMLSINSFSSCTLEEYNTNRKTNDSTFVEKHGNLSVDGTHIVDQTGYPISLRGMSLFWSQWMGKFYNSDCISWLTTDWKCTIIRAAMGIESGGYLQNPQVELNKVKVVIDACIEAGIYVIVDWHDHTAQDHQTEAIDFFKQIAQQYGNYPNIIYEIFNEPLQVSWTNVVRPYSIAVIDSIRKIDPDNLILVGSPTWSQDVDSASLNPISRTNIAYTLHFYAATHKQALRNKAVTAMNNGIVLFVSEWGTCEASGKGALDYTEVETWLNFMESHKISWCNWSLCDKDETSAALEPGAASNGNWSASMLSPSGTLVRYKIILYNDLTANDGISTGYQTNFTLYRNFPVPFNPNTIIRFELPRSGNVKLEVYDVRGEKIKTLIESYVSSGKHLIVWNGLSNSKEKLASGVYFINLIFEHYSQHKKTILIN
jgi:endoglucanase